jgi:hypothetical protein
LFTGTNHPCSVRSGGTIPQKYVKSGIRFFKNAPLHKKPPAVAGGFFLWQRRETSRK